MRFWLAAVGRAKPGPARDLYEEYLGRLQWSLTLREVEAKRRAGGAELKRLEAEALRAALPPSATLVALDERGRDLSSEGFAGHVSVWRDGGVSDVAFLIGGADGLDPGLRNEAALVIRFGAMTWPHLLVRGMLAEQLYRAQQILAGHPYHRA